MTREDLRIFCTALSFTAVLFKGPPTGRNEQKIRAIAGLMESFCLEHVPEALTVTSRKPRRQAATNLKREKRHGSKR
ncbi:MAG: hypothetical protein GC191_08325 [Azospirillum sp.]|nr:hypothetical protein [Azospirillum sp.]